MILAHPQLNTVLDFTTSGVCSLVVEQPDLYRELLCDLYDQLQGMPGKLILSESDSPLSVSKWVELVDNCLQLDLNRKPLLNKITTALEQTAVSETFFLKTADILQRAEAYMEALAFSLPCDIVCERCTVAGLIKAVGVSLRNEYADPLERLVDYMELVREYDRDKLFVLLGLRSLFSDEMLEPFVKTVADHGYRVLLLDHVEGKKFPVESRLTVDKDLCEF